MTHETETKDLVDLDLKAGLSGRIEGYGSVFNNVDQGGDIVAPGAFAQSLKSRSVKMLWQHDPNKVIGVWDEIREDAHGLRVKGRVIEETEQGREALALLRNKAIDGLSIGYRTVKAGRDGNARVIQQADLWEVSLVTFGMNEAAKIDSVKALSTQQDVEKLLRKTGLPWGACKKIAAGGWPALRGSELTEIEQKEIATTIREIAGHFNAEPKGRY